MRNFFDNFVSYTFLPFVVVMCVVLSYIRFYYCHCVCAIP